MRLKETIFVGAACLALSVGAGASQSEEPVLDEVGAELAKLAEEFVRREREWDQSIVNDALEYTDDELSDAEFLTKLRNETPPYVALLLSQMLELAERHPDSPFALDALSFAIRCRSQSGDPQGAAWQAGEQALDLVLKHHMNDPRVTQIFGRLSISQPTKKAEALLRTALAESSDRATRAAAVLSLARYLQSHGQHHQIAEKLNRKSRLTNFERMLKVFLAPYLEQECPYEHEKATAEIERLLARIINEYRDVPAKTWNYSGPVNIFFRPDTAAKPKTYGKLARAMRFKRNKLAPGKKAPDIEGIDAYGNNFRLSDYQGKVVLLTFSADWCGPCRSLYPMQRELVDKFRDEAFVMLSVSMDKQVDTLKASLASGEITWRCWWDGLDGPISSDWKASSPPSIFLFDDQGIIQDVWLNRATAHEVFERVIAELLSRVPARKTQRP